MENELKTLNNNIINGFIKYEKYIDKFNYDDYNFALNNNEYEIINNIILQNFNTYINNINNYVKILKKKNKKYNKLKLSIIKKIDNLMIDNIKTHTYIDSTKIIIENDIVTKIDNIHNIINYKKFNNNFINEHHNIDIIDDNELINNYLYNNENEYEIIKLPKKKLINIGYNNYYKLPEYEYLSSNIPLNVIVYINNINSVVIKIGNEEKYKYINAIIGRVPENNNCNNIRSIICNNNIVKYNKKCQNGLDCSYYHDPIIGYSDISHKERQYSHNPLIYNCTNFKDGKYIKDNVKKISWEDGLNLYQSSFACILLGLIHSLED